MALMWHGARAGNKLLTTARKRVQEAVLIVEAATKGLLSRRGGRTASGGHEKGERLEKVGIYRSKPGEPPRKQTGTLVRSITSEMHPTLPIGRVGPANELEYARALELGYDPRNLAPRPYLRPALRRSEPAIRAIFNRPMEGE